MKPIELTPVQSLLRESIMTRIHQTAEALCVADKEGNNKPLQQNPLDLFTAIAAQVVSTNNNEDEISRVVHIGGLFVARYAKLEHMLGEAIKKNDELSMMLKERDEHSDLPVIEPDDFSKAEEGETIED